MHAGMKQPSQQGLSHKSGSITLPQPSSGLLVRKQGPSCRVPGPCNSRSLVVQHAAASQQQERVSVDMAFTPGKETEARRTLFNRISGNYDELNNMLSLGQHWVWKSMAVKWSKAQPGQKVLDVCCGSGDLALLLSKVVGPTGKVVGLDFASEMLRDAEQRQQREQADLPASRRTNMEWIQGDAQDLPFNNAEFDAATMGYGLRNVADRLQALRELHRVLKPGASAAVLDFNNNPDPVVDSFQGFMLENVVVPVATQYGLESEYAYLRPSIKAFPQGKEQEDMAKRAGFVRAVHYPVGFGLMGILVVTKGR